SHCPFGGFVARQIAKIGLCYEVISHDCSKCEKQQGNGHKALTDQGEMSRNCPLCKLRTEFYAWQVFYNKPTFWVHDIELAGEDDHQGGSGADKPSIDIHGKCLDQALARRMGYF